MSQLSLTEQTSGASFGEERIRDFLAIRQSGIWQNSSFFAEAEDQMKTAGRVDRR
jgi:hypothetical protein